jgi:hypothetical protein
MQLVSCSQMTVPLMGDGPTAERGFYFLRASGKILILSSGEGLEA